MPNESQPIGTSDQTYTVICQIVDAHGTPLAGLQVKAFDNDPKSPDDPLGYPAITDATGQVQFRFKTSDFSEHPGERNPDLYFKIYRDHTELEHPLDGQGDHFIRGSQYQPGIINITVAKHQVVKGTLRDQEDGSPIPALTVQLFDLDLNQTELQATRLGETTSHADGTYVITYQPPINRSLHLQIRVYDSPEATTELAKAEPRYHAIATEAIDVRVKRTRSPQPSEFHKLTQTLKPVLQTRNIARLADLNDQQVPFLAGIARLPEAHLKALKTAQQLESQTHVPSAIFYALQRQGLPADLDALYQYTPQTLHAALETALQHNIIATTNDQTLEQSHQRLETCILDHAVNAACQDQLTSNSMGKLLTSVEPDPAQRRQIVQTLLTRQRQEPNSPFDAFWPQLEADLHLGFPKIKALRFALQVGQITRNHLPLVSALQALHQQGQILSAMDLALWHTQEWAEWLQNIADSDLPDQAEGDTPEAKRNYLAALLPQQAATVFPAATVNQYLISGRILTPAGRPLPQVRVQAFHQEFTTDQPTPIGSAAKTRADGSYQIVLDPFQLAEALPTEPVTLPLLHLHISATQANQEQESKRSDMQYNLTLPVTIDLTMEGEPEPTEFEQVRDRIHQVIGADHDPANLQPEKLTWLAGVTRIDPKTLERFAEAHRLATQPATEQAPTLSPEVHYALLHPIAQKVSREKISAAQSLEVAIAEGIVSPTVQASAQAAESWLQERARQQEVQTRLGHLRTPISQGPGASLKEILTAVDLSEDEFNHYTQILAEEPDAAPERIQLRLRDKGVSSLGQATIRRTQRLTQIVGPEDDLIKHLVAEMPPLSGSEDPGSTAQDEAKLQAFAQNDTDDWEALLKPKAVRFRRLFNPIRSATGNTAAVPPPSPRQQACHLAAAFEKAFPTHALLGRLNKQANAQTEQPSNAPNFADLKGFLAEQSKKQSEEKSQKQGVDLFGQGLKFQLLHLNQTNGNGTGGDTFANRSVIHDFVRQQDPNQDADGINARATQLEQDLASLQRLLRIAPSTEAVHLLSKGHISARSIAAMSRESLVQQMVEAGRPADDQDRAFLQQQARTIHRRASRQYSKALAITTALCPQFQKTSPSAISGHHKGKKGSDPGHSGNPGGSGEGTGGSGSPSASEGANLEALFGSQDACLVPPSQSVLGTTAYLVDLLELLSHSGAESQNPQAVLLERRPDIAELELSTANAETPVPYIDLVIELLEQEVAGQPTEESEYPQTSWADDELAAMPEHLNPEAYEALENAVFPWSLPFNFAQAKATTYLADLGLSRDNLFHKLRFEPVNNQADQASLERASVYLGITPSERQIIATRLGQTSATFEELWRYWGHQDDKHPGNWPQTDAENVRTFLNRSGIEYTELIDLLCSDYINPKTPNSDNLEPPRQVQLGSNINPPVTTDDLCDLSKMKLAGVNEPFLNRFHRFVRLWRRLGWSIQDLDRAITIFHTPDLTDMFLIQVAAVQRLAERLKLPIATVLTFWGNLNTQPATVIVSATFGHLQDSSLELNALKPCPAWMTPY